MILRGGENISPAEIEEVLLSHPAVAAAVCFGVDSEKYGEEVAAAVALSGDADERSLIAHCGERLAAFKVPRTIHILDAIPRTATGTLQRRRVAAFIEEEGLAR
jgi:acyl-CoA synthetase (AMP-forming)/AMP-acid ligase II